MKPIRFNIAAALACLALLAGCSKEAPPVLARLAEGRPFPALKLDSTSDNALAAKAFQGKMLVLNVWATWCPPCRREMPSLERLSHVLDANRFAVVGMSTDEDELLASEFLLQNGITFTNFFDRNGKFAKQIGMTMYPETFLIAPDGTLVLRVQGLREWDSAPVLAELEQAYQRYQIKAGGKSHVAK